MESTQAPGDNTTHHNTSGGQDATLIEVDELTSTSPIDNRKRSLETNSPDHRPDKMTNNASTPPHVYAQQFMPIYTPHRQPVFTDLSGTGQPPQPPPHQNPGTQASTTTTIIGSPTSQIPGGSQMLRPPVFQHYQTPAAEDCPPPPWARQLMIQVQTLQQSLDVSSRDTTFRLDSLGQSIDEVKSTMSALSQRISKVETGMRDLTNVPKRLDELEHSTQFISNQYDDMQASNETTNNNLCDMKKELEDMRNEIIHEKTRSMRSNLLFYGIPESRGEDPEKLVRDLVEEKMGLPMKNVEMMRTHRLGPHKPNQKRPIVANFHRYTEKEAIRKAAYGTLKSTSFGVSEQFPPEIVARRKLLIPILKSEKQKHGIHSTRLVIDKVYSPTATYSVKNGIVHTDPPQRSYQNHPNQPAHGQRSDSTTHDAQRQQQQHQQQQQQQHQPQQQQQQLHPPQQQQQYHQHPQQQQQYHQQQPQEQTDRQQFLMQTQQIAQFQRQQNQIGSNQPAPQHALSAHDPRGHAPPMFTNTVNTPPHPASMDAYPSLAHTTVTAINNPIQLTGVNTGGIPDCNDAKK